MFAELGPIRSGEPQPSIFDSVLDEPLPDVARVVAYLRAGHLLISAMDIADDPFQPGRQIMNGSSVQTDGDWMWRKDLAQFVQRHRVALPPDFLALIRERDYQVPDRDEPTLITHAKQAEALMFGGH